MMLVHCTELLPTTVDSRLARERVIQGLNTAAAKVEAVQVACELWRIPQPCSATVVASA